MGSATQLLDARAYERHMLARRLHDTVSQSLVALSLQMEFTLDAAPEPAIRERIGEALKLLHRCVGEVRALSDSLHPLVLEELPLHASIKKYLEGFSRQTGFGIALQVEGDCDGAPREIQSTVLAFLHDNLLNFVLYSRERSTLVRVWRDGDSLQAGITDASNRNHCNARFAFPSPRE